MSVSPGESIVRHKQDQARDMSVPVLQSWRFDCDCNPVRSYTPPGTFATKRKLGLDVYPRISTLVADTIASILSILKSIEGRPCGINTSR